MKEWRECKICGATATSCHHVFGAANRKFSEKYNLKFNVCLDCHENLTNDKEFCDKYRAIYQRAFIKKYGEELWWKVFKQSWEK